MDLSGSSLHQSQHFAQLVLIDQFYTKSYARRGIGEGTVNDECVKISSSLNRHRHTSFRVYTNMQRCKFTKTSITFKFTITTPKQIAPELLVRAFSIVTEFYLTKVKLYSRFHAFCQFVIARNMVVNGFMRYECFINHHKSIQIKGFNCFLTS